MLNSIAYTAEEETKADNSDNINSAEETDNKEFKLYSGIILGTNFTANYQHNATGDVSPNIALFAEYPFFKDSSVAFEFGYWQRRWEITGRDDEAIEITTDFLNMQLDLRHRFETDPVQPYLIFGLYLDYTLGGNFKSDGHEYDYSRGKYIKKAICGSVWGIGGEYSLDKWGTIFLEAGLLIPFKEPLSKKNNASFEQENGYYQDYFIQIGYKYDIAGLF